MQPNYIIFSDLPKERDASAISEVRPPTHPNPVKPTCRWQHNCVISAVLIAHVPYGQKGRLHLISSEFTINPAYIVQISSSELRINFRGNNGLKPGLKSLRYGPKDYH